MAADDYRVTEVDGQGRAKRTAYSGKDYREAGAAEDRLLTAGKSTKVTKGDQVLSDRTPARKWGRS